MILAPRLPGLLALLALAVTSLACGHPATQQECEEILDKVVELELKGQFINDPAILEQRKKTAREAKAKDLLPRCTGRKITEAAMACIRQAQSYDDIDNRCLR
ncbi:MAG: hypothetical protein MUF64_04265 [Polyangiaceae bacterium]|jgi:hypothetical protein|nr:hypothetical protein [Polyangiaceae bacterium]